MIIKVVHFNKKREVIKVDRYPAKLIRLQPAGLIEISNNQPDDIKYIRFLATDLVDVLIED